MWCLESINDGLYWNVVSHWRHCLYHQHFNESTKWERDYKIKINESQTADCCPCSFTFKYLRCFKRKNLIKKRHQTELVRTCCLVHY